MLRLLAQCLALPVLVVVCTLLCSQTAFAGDLIDGDGYEMRVPPGFHELPTGDT